MTSNWTSNMLPAVRRLFILFHAGILWTMSKAEASFCTPDQVNKCRNAAKSDNLSKLPAGGVCAPNGYVEYTHQCLVTNYIPSADYCCCAYERKVFCCRYHYDWNYFRCNEAEDTIHELPMPTVASPTTVNRLTVVNQDGGRTPVPLAIEILVPAIVVPSVALLCFFFYCIKCCCCNDDDDDEGHTCDLLSRCRRRRRRRKKSTTLRQNHYTTAPDNQRSTLLPSLKDSSISNSSKVSEKCDPLMDIKYPPLDRTQPTAPPYDATGPPAPPPPCNFDNPPPYNPDLYDPVVVSSQHLNGTALPFIRSRNEFGQDVIYQPVIAHAHIPLPVTKLPEHAQLTAASEQKNVESSVISTNDEQEKR